MADNDKKGAQNISDLKARLGLKKQGGAAPGVPGPVSAPTPLVPASLPGSPRPSQAPLPTALSGIPAPGSVPPPPGFSRPSEAAPPPDPRRDPFAAQQAAVAANLAAFYTGGALPGDASAAPAEPIEKPNRLPLIAGIGGAAVVFFAVGYIASNIMSGRADFNETTDHAAKIRDEVTKIEKSVTEVETTLREPAKEKGAINFAALTKVRDMDFKEPEVTRSLFHTNYYSFDPQGVQALFNYYNDVVVLARQVQDHAQKTLNDKDDLEKFQKSAVEHRDSKVMGVILDPSQRVPTSQMVEIAGSSCIDKVEDISKCSLDSIRVRVKTSLGGQGADRPLKGRPTEVVYQIAPSELQQQFQRGDPSMLSHESYIRRLRLIKESLDRIKEDYKQLQSSLDKRAKEPKLFSF